MRAPACAEEDNDRQPATCEVLLVLQVRVGGYENVKTLGLRQRNKFAVIYLRPTAFVRGFDDVPDKGMSKWRGVP